MSVAQRTASQHEVVMGPNSTLYGAGALVGVVNIVTRKPQPHAEIVKRVHLQADGGLTLTESGHRHVGDHVLSAMYNDHNGALAWRLTAGRADLASFEYGGLHGKAGDGRQMGDPSAERIGRRFFLGMRAAF